MNTKLLQNSQE